MACMKRGSRPPGSRHPNASCLHALQGFPLWVLSSHVHDVWGDPLGQAHLYNEKAPRRQRPIEQQNGLLPRSHTGATRATQNRHLPTTLQDTPNAIKHQTEAIRPIIEAHCGVLEGGHAKNLVFGRIPAPAMKDPKKARQGQGESQESRD